MPADLQSQEAFEGKPEEDGDWVQEKQLGASWGCLLPPVFTTAGEAVPAFWGFQGAPAEPLSEADLKVPQLEEAANASLDYLAGAQSIDQNTTAWKTYSDATRAEFRLPLSDNRKATVETIIAENASALSRVKAARGETIGSWNDGNDFAEFSGSVNMRFEPQRRLVTLLTLAALNEHVQTNDRAALDWLKDAIALAAATTE